MRPHDRRRNILKLKKAIWLLTCP